MGAFIVGAEGFRPSGQGTEPETNEPRYFVSNLLRPLIRPLITDDEYTQACAAAARSLYGIWVTAGQAADASVQP